MNRPVTIVIERETRDCMKHLARKDQTYDDLLNELIKLKEKSK